MEFREIRLADRERVEALRNLGAHKTSSHAFVSLYLWRKAQGLTITFTEKAFCVKATEGYYFPCGEKDAVLALCRAIAEEEPTATWLYVREEDLMTAQEVLGKTHRFCEKAEAREYLYAREEQIEMKGKRFCYQRAKVNKARRAGVMCSEALEDRLLPSAVALTQEWAARRGADKGDCEQTLEALSLFHELSLFGNMLFCDGKAVGFNLGSYLAPDTVDIHIAKTLQDDVDTLMKWELYQMLPSSVETINREEDLGIRGLALHKQDAQPCGYNVMWFLYHKDAQP